MNIQKIAAGLEKSGVKLVDDTHFQRYSRFLKNNNKDELLGYIKSELQFIKDFNNREAVIANINKASLNINK